MDWLGFRQVRIQKALAKCHLRDGVVILYDGEFKLRGRQHFRSQDAESPDKEGSAASDTGRWCLWSTGDCLPRHEQTRR